MTQRIVCWFSCGAASACATKLAIEENNRRENPLELVVVSIYLKDEHPDSERFKKECSDWFGQEIIELRNDKYDASVDNVIMSTRYMSGVYGARCTKELKKQVRYDWQKPDDIHVFGMTVDEQDRIDGLLDTEPELELSAPLIDVGMTKIDCFAMLNDVGIDLPEMYKLGYHNNNCIGCLKAGGAGYWNKIRVDFPDVFERRLNQEKMLGVALVKISLSKFKKLYPDYHRLMVINDDLKLQVTRKKNTKGVPYDYKMLYVPLRYLPPNAGTHKDLDIGACGFFCEIKD